MPMSEHGFKGTTPDPTPRKMNVAKRNLQRVVSLNSLALPHVAARSTPDGSGGGSSATSVTEAALVARSRGG